MQSRLKREQARAKATEKPYKGPAPSGLTIEAIKAQVAIEDVVSHLGGQVNRIGSGWSKVGCPFHDDRNPSASIHPVEGRFHCFSCDISGDVIDLAMRKLETNEMKEALEWLHQTFLTTNP